ncbi:hypothetical protein AOLI_G00263450 [Acnodon oligacanthus]
MENYTLQSRTRTRPPLSDTACIAHIAPITRISLPISTHALAYATTAVLQLACAGSPVLQVYIHCKVENRNALPPLRVFWDQAPSLLTRTDTRCKLRDICCVRRTNSTGLRSK